MTDQPLAVSRRPTKLVVGAVVIVAVVAGLIVWAMNRSDATSFFVTTSQVARLGPAAADHEYRVGGRVMAGSVRHHGVRTTFRLTDGRDPLTVTTRAALPDTFKAGASVIAQGTYSGHVLRADQVLAKCPSKFKPKD